MDKFQQFLLWAPVVLFSMVAHEYAHGFAALKQGDPTAYQLGRLTWNPVKHIDPVLTVLMPIVTYWTMGFIFGGAKPVPVVPRNYRNYRRGDIIVSLAGIAVNLLLFVLCIVLIVVLGFVGQRVPAAGGTLAIVQQMMIGGIIINLVLAFFNLIPIPPLDGSHVVKHILPASWALRYQQFGRYGFLILIVMLATGMGRSLLDTWMKPVQVLFRQALGITSPYLLQSPIGLGI